MLQTLIVSILCKDRPGITKQFAQPISLYGGNWLESQLVQMAGKFAGVIRVGVPSEQAKTLEKALLALSGTGVQIQIDHAEQAANSTTENLAQFSLAGPDRKGIVFEISQAFAEHQINIESLNTHCSSMPYSGDPLFEADGTISVPQNIDIDELQEQLLSIADQLGVDVQLTHNTP